MEKKITKKNKTLKTLVTKVSFASFILFLLFGCNNTVDNKAVINKDMLKAASEINKNCPIMIDSITRCDNTIALTNNTLHFNYTILNATKSDFDTLSLAAIKPVTLNSLKTDPKYQVFRSNKASLSFSYYDKDGNYLCNFRVTPLDYEQ